MAMQAEPDASGKALSPPRNAVVHAWLTAGQVAYLQRAADRLRIHVDHLVALILLGAIADGSLGSRPIPD